MRFFYDVSCSCVQIINTNGRENAVIDIPLYFKNFLNEVLGKHLIHKNQCNTSKLSYLRTDYINILCRAGPYLDYVLRQIRKIDKMIYRDLMNIEIDCDFILHFFNGETVLRLFTGEILFYSTDELFCRLLFSCITK